MPDFRIIPSIEQMRQRPEIGALEREFGRGAIVGALQQAADDLRRALAGEPGTAGNPEPPNDRQTAAAFLEARSTALLRAGGRSSLLPVINATGVIVHTNLGRAPLAESALTGMRVVGAGYANLEFDLASGQRGRRDVHAEAQLCSLLKAESAVVVNNNASATMLMLAALASRREVVVSRGELVEIGGGFRVPDVMAQSGARLREVGTTNRTRIDDYRDAIGPETALLLRVHRSNFRIEGFTEQPAIHELAALGRERGIPVAEDQGSGYIGLPNETDGQKLDDCLRGEPKVQDSLAAGIDVVCFSGDKLLGGPQAGILVGRRTLIEPIRRHPLMRAVRVDKLTYAALEGTLAEYTAGRAGRTVPVLRMVLMSTAEVGARAEAVGRAVTAALTEAGCPGRLRLEVIDGQSTIGGGSAPGLELPTRLLAVSHATVGPDDLDAALRRNDPPVVARIDRGRLVLDLRTVSPDEDRDLGRALVRTAGPASLA